MNCATAPSHSRSSSTSSVYTQVLEEDPFSAFILGVISSQPNPNKFFDTSIAEDGFEKDQPSFRSQFSWRQDPDDSLSDWTIEITGTFEDDSKKLAFHTYYVHKCKLGAGPRRSIYFQTLFSMAPHLSEHQEQTSRIELLEAEVSSFERMLDFMYGLESDDDVVTTANAVVMRYLSVYFQCGALMMQVNTFLGHDLVPANGPHYLLEATKYHDQRLQMSAANLCSAHVDKLPKDDLNGLPMELFQRILRSSDMTCSSIKLSMVVANYLDYHSDEVNAAIIVDMSKNLDEFDERASQIIMGMVRKLNPRDDLISWKSLESIVVRCARATNWQTLDVKALRASFEHDWETDFDFYQATSFAAIRAATALKSAQREYDDVVGRKDAELLALHEENSELQLEKNSLVAEISSLEDEIYQLRNQLELSKISADGGQRTYRDSTLGGRGRRYVANFRIEY